MPRNFHELENQMDPQSLARAKIRASEMMAEMLLANLRQDAGLTQEELAESLGIRQPTLSRLESRDDMRISTLRRLIQALGGDLEIIARLPTGDVRLTQFTDVA